MPPQHHPAATGGSSLGRYWIQNLRLMAVLLVVWATAGLGCGVLVADRLNDSGIMLGGFPLGFWFAQQGSIIVFILLILIYAIAMNRLDGQHHRDGVQTGTVSGARGTEPATKRRRSEARRSGHGPRRIR